MCLCLFYFLTLFHFVFKKTIYINIIILLLISEPVFFIIYSSISPYLYSLRRKFTKESKKVRKQENTLSTKKATKKKKKNLSFFWFVFMVESVFSFFSLFFLDRFLGRKRIFLFSYSAFFYKFPPQAI